MEDQDKQIPFAAITRYPSPICADSSPSSDEARIAYIAARFREILETLGLDLSDESLSKTPMRVARMYVSELFSGLSYDNFPRVTTFECPTEDPGTVVVRDISVATICEHHLLPVTGRAHVAYKPKGKIIGLSKVHRIVRYFCRRPQLQERLTAQIADCLELLLGTGDIAVSIRADHGCVRLRGVRDEQSVTETHLLKGVFDAAHNPFKL